MAYNLAYYSDRAMRVTAPDADQVGGLEWYPAPTGRETATARHSEDRSLDRYGYDGGWHVELPREAVEADEADERAARERAAVADYASRPHVTGVLAHDHAVVVVRVPGKPGSVHVRVSELEAATHQADAEARATYSPLLAEARAAIARAQG